MAQKRRPNRNTADCFIDPGRLYTRKAFLAAAGLGDTTIRQARRAGVELVTLTVGRQPYIRGRDGIDFIEKLASLQRSDEER